MIPHDSILVAFNNMLWTVSKNCAYTSPLMAINIGQKKAKYKVFWLTLKSTLLLNLE